MRNGTEEKQFIPQGPIANQAKMVNLRSVYPPTQDARHHQNYYIFSRESVPKPLCATGILGYWWIQGKSP